MKTITLYDLCERTCESIKLSPPNYRQESWAVRAADYVPGTCGTAFCRAGWMMAHVQKPQSTEAWCRMSNEGFIKNDAYKLLKDAGIPDIAITELFSGAAVQHALLRIAKQGSRNYVAAGVEGMRVFMATHEAKLKAATVEVWDGEGKDEGATCRP